MQKMQKLYTSKDKEEATNIYNIMLEEYKDKFDYVAISEPLLGEVGDTVEDTNTDKETVAKAITNEAVSEGSYDSLDAAEEDGVAFVFMGHGTSHTAKVTYSQMQTQVETLGYKNVFIGTVEGVERRHLRGCAE